MTTQELGLFKALSAKMRYLNQRQGLLSQNIANADTPGYKPYDLKAVDFTSVLRKTVQQSASEPVRTNPAHISSYNDILSPKATIDKTVYDVEPSGNAVSMEDQMLKATRNQMDYNLMTSLYQKNVNMVRTALGRSQ